jgi:hypothetical protein
MFESVVAPAGAPEGDGDEGVDGGEGGVEETGAEEVETSRAPPPHPVIPKAQTATKNQRNVFIG